MSRSARTVPPAARPGLALLLGTALLAGLAGCGSSDQDDRLPPADDPVAWTGRLCGALAPMASLPPPPADQLDPNAPAIGRAALIAYFDSAAQAADQSLAGLDQAGPAPSGFPAGQNAASSLRTSVTTLRGAYVAAKDKINKIDPDDPIGLSSQLPPILGALAVTTHDAHLASLGDDPTLRGAMAQAPQCALLPRPSPTN